MQRASKFLMISVMLLLTACGEDTGDGPNEAISSPEPKMVQEASGDGFRDGTIVASPSVQSDDNHTSAPTADSTNLDSDGDGLYTAAEFQIALTYASVEFEFAPDFPMTSEQAWANFIAINPEQATEAEYEVGLERTMLGGYFECGWMLTWVDAYVDGDVEAQENALAHLQVLLEPGYFDDQASRDYIASMLHQARLGDPAGMQQYTNANCQRIDWAT